RGGVPDGVAGLLGHFRLARRRGPALAADADRVRRHREAVVRVIGKVVQPHARQIDDDTLARRIGQDRPRRQIDRRVLARQPVVYARVRAPQLFVPDAVLAGYRGKGVLVAREQDLDLADDLGGRGDLVEPRVE